MLQTLLGDFLRRSIPDRNDQFLRLTTRGGGLRDTHDLDGRLVGKPPIDFTFKLDVSHSALSIRIAAGENLNLHGWSAFARVRMPWRVEASSARERQATTAHAAALGTLKNLARQNRRRFRDVNPC